MVAIVTNVTISPQITFKDTSLNLCKPLKVPTTTITMEIKQVKRITAEQLPSIAHKERSSEFPIEKGITNSTLRIFVAFLIFNTQSYLYLKYI